MFSLVVMPGLPVLYFVSTGFYFFLFWISLFFAVAECITLLYYLDLTVISPFPEDFYTASHIIVLLGLRCVVLAHR